MLTPEIERALLNTSIRPRDYTDWVEDSIKWRGAVLTGKKAHWCLEFDGLPMDETCEREIDICQCWEASDGEA